MAFLSRFLKKSGKSVEKTTGDGNEFFKPFTPLRSTMSFQPTLEDEIGVSQGEIILGLYSDAEWTFVEKKDKSQGFVPTEICESASAPPWMKLKQPLRTKPEKSKRSVEVEAVKMEPEKPRTVSSPRAAENVSRFLQSLDEDKASERAVDIVFSSYGHTEDFKKVSQGLLQIRHNFTGIQDSDLSVSKGETVELLNSEDKDWFWVRRTDGLDEEGFVPASFTSRLPSEPVATATASEYYVGENFAPHAKDDLAVAEGDWVWTAQVPSEAPGGWLWALSSKTQQRGFIPASILRSPHTTSL